MFYRPAEGCPLPHDPFSAIVAPRPIAWIGTRGRLGDNLAPYSFFNAVAYSPPQLVFASTSAKADRDGTKDTLAQIRESGVFSVNLVAPEALGAMNASSAPLPAGGDEFSHAGVAKAECEAIACPRVADAPATLECRLVQVIALLGETNFLVHGEVLGVHIRPDCLQDGRFAPPARLARLGYRDYARIDVPFALERPPGG
jgi:flavin reductase (DIM6/NTAB) family NADH-FMN oxidoreductase RutF